MSDRTDDLVAHQIRVWKDALIDLTRRNPLLSLSIKAKSNLRLTQPSLDDLYALLGNRRKSLLFTPDVPDDQEVLDLQNLKTKVQPRKPGVVPLSESDLKTLNSIRQRAALTLQEQGVNTLFVTFGILEWPDPQTKTVLLSPLLLVPAILERNPGDSSARLRRFDDDAELNPTLVYRLGQRDIQVTLPVLPDEEKINPSAYLDAVETAIAGRIGWQVRRDCYLGRFSFLKLTMYKDLEALTVAAQSHPLVAALAGDKAALQRLPAVTIPSASSLDEETQGQEMFQVLDADPSQQRAVLAARDGQSFVLQGPPGTGKTQTIANIITECVAASKRVLFVSQKMAALDAVFKRLRDQGLADLCLEAHSHKATKKEVLEQLGRSLQSQVSPERLKRGFLEELAASRRKLNETVAEMHQSREPLRASVYEAAGIVALASGVPDLPFVFVAPEAVSAEEYRRLETIAEQLAMHHSLFADVVTHPWRGVLATRFSLNLQTEVRVTFDDLFLLIERIERDTQSLSALCGLTLPVGFSGTDWLLRVAQMIEATPRPPAEWLTDDSLEELRSTAEKCRQRYKEYLSTRTAMLEHYREDIFTLSHTDIRARLWERHDSLLRPALGEDWPRKAAASGDEISSLFSGIANKTERLRRGLATLASMCGLPLTDTLAFGRYLLRVSQIACDDPKPRPEWFEAGAVPALVRRMDEACEHHEQLFSSQTALLNRYTDQIFKIDTATLLPRFQEHYATFLRYFKPDFYRHRRIVCKTLKPGAVASDDISLDLALAEEVRGHRDWIQTQEHELEETFSIHYRGMDTDWDGLRAALKRIEELAGQFSGRQIPVLLQERMVASGPEIEALAEMRHQVEAQLAALSSDLSTLHGWRGTDDLPFTDMPFSQAPLDDLWKWTLCVRGSLDDHLAARAAVLGVSRTADNLIPSDVLAAYVGQAQGLLEAEHAIQCEKEALQNRYAAFYQGLTTDWNGVLEALDWTGQLRTLFQGNLPDPLVQVATQGVKAVIADIAAARIALAAGRQQATPLVGKLGELFPPERLQAAGRDLQTASFPAVLDWLQIRLSRLNELERWIGFQNLRETCADAGLLSFFDTTTNRVPRAEDVVPVFRKRFYRLWLDTVTDGVPVLRQFRGEDYAAQISRFVALDLHQIDTAADRVRASAASRKPASLSNFGEIGALRQQLRRKRPKAIRKIFQDIPNLLCSLKPCLLMSPLTVSLFLDPEKITFDIVIFDEASQIFVQDAVGALLRGKQAIIAGDVKQLPPTSFFMNLQDDGSDDEENEEQPVTAGEFESVLNAADALAIEQSPHFAMHPLRWHYRSRHEDLIAFSRRHFYDSLITFPSATQEAAVRFSHVPNGIYRGGKGSKRDNPVEAAHVVDLVIAQIRAEPEWSVGVITFSESQQQAVQTEIDARKREDPSLETLLSEKGSEGFFVKNIENVQGDERDAIVLSVGYGRDPQGNLYMRFGPLNAEGGERRLNVAITRARQRCTVVSSILPQDIVSDRPGPKLLRAYLELAQGEGRNTGNLIGTQPPYPGDFERAVEKALTAAGHRVQRQVGLFDYRVDLAVVDSEHPDHFLLGIECDGPMYQNAENARARDRLRPEVLRNLGWRLLRLWSADWVRDSEGELRRIEAAITRVKQGEYLAPARPQLVKEDQASYTTEGDETSARTLTGLPPGVAYYERVQIFLPGTAEALYDEDTQRRAKFLQRLIDAEGPISLDAAAQRLAEAAGLARTGSRVRSLIDETIEEMVMQERIDVRDEFLWSKGCEQPSPRVPHIGEAPRHVDQICREEIGELIVALLKVAFGMRRDELITETARLLGYRSAGVNIRERINETLSLLELDNRIHVQGGQIRALEL